MIGIEHLSEEMTACGRIAGEDTGVRSAHNLLDTQIIYGALERNNFNRQAAAKELGIHKSTLFRMMKRFDIPLPKQDGRSNRNKTQ